MSRYESFLRLDLTDPGDKELADYGARILTLLRSPHAQKSHFLVATLDDFLGVLYALIFARHNNFVERNGPIEVPTVVKRAENVAEGIVRTSSKWLAGFYFNSALFRIAAAYHRGLKVVSGKETCGLYKAALLKIVEPEFSEWLHTNLDKVWDEVNDLKHEAEGLFNSRDVSREQATAAVAELLELFELWNDRRVEEPMALVFQYGSNCLGSEINSNNRLCGDAQFLDIAETVEDFELAFDVQSAGRGCAASDIVRRPGGKVWGVLYEVPDYLIGCKIAKAASVSRLTMSRARTTNGRQSRSAARTVRSCRR
ncbi:MAG: gamma-glutamylcyclotransferase family protein [Candidatus Acidiferrum sp.]|jgi:hypothetical protein